MNRNKFREILYIFIAIFLSILAVKIFIWMLPVLLVVFLALYLYSKFKMSKYNFKYEKYEKEVYKDVEKKGTKINDKKIVIIDEEK